MEEKEVWVRDEESLFKKSMYNKEEVELKRKSYQFQYIKGNKMKGRKKKRS